MFFAAAPDSTRLTPEYKCGTSAAPGICYGVGDATHRLFRGIQDAANYFSRVARFAPIYLDGKIGAETVKALQKTVQYLLREPTTASLGTSLVNAVATEETVAAGSLRILGVLQDAIQRLELNPVPSPSPPVPKPPSPLPPPPPYERHESRVRPWLKWTMAGAGLLVLGLGGWLLLREQDY